MTIVRPPYALEREAPLRPSTGSINTLALTEEDVAKIVKHPIGFVPPEPTPEPEPKPIKKTKHIQ